MSQASTTEPTVKLIQRSATAIKVQIKHSVFKSGRISDHILTLISGRDLVRTTNRRPSRCPTSMLAALVCLILAGCDKQPGLPDEVQGLTLKTLTGKEIVLADVNNPVLINFWATDCVICVREMPSLTSLYRQYSASGFELVAVAMPYDPPNLVLDMAEQEQWPFPVALDITGEVLSSFATVKGTPTSFLLDKDGQLVKRYVGAVPMQKLRKELEKLLGLT